MTGRPRPQYYVGIGLGLLSATILVFCLHIAAISHVIEARHQKTGFDSFRSAAALGIAPVGQSYPKPTPSDLVEAASASPSVSASASPSASASASPSASASASPGASASASPSASASASPGASASASPSPSASPVIVKAAPERLMHPGGTPMALMDIPALRIRQMVVGEGTSAGDLMRGPGHVRTSVFPGQAGTAVFYGRRWTYGQPFFHLDQLRKGDAIVIVTGQGQSKYVVTGQRKGGEVEVLPAAGKGRLTLVTAAGAPFSADEALYVDADLVSEPMPRNRITPLPVETAEAAFAADPDAWLAILLWVQGLALAAAAFTVGWFRWGKAQTWLTGGPVIVALMLGLSNALARLLPNLT